MYTSFCKFLWEKQGCALYMGSTKTWVHITHGSASYMAKYGKLSVVDFYEKSSWDFVGD